MKRFLLCKVTEKGKLKILYNIEGEDEVRKINRKIQLACKYMQEINSITNYGTLLYDERCRTIVKEMPTIYDLVEQKDMIVIPYFSLNVFD